MEETKVKEEPASVPAEDDDPPDMAAIIMLMNQRVDDVKSACMERIDSLEKGLNKKLNIYFKISIGISLAVLIAYASLPPETIKTLVETICNILAK